MRNKKTLKMLNTVVYDDELVILVGPVRMSVPLARHAVGGPTSVRDADVDI